MNDFPMHHTTRTGERLPIAAMTSEHLCNLIAMLCDKMAAARAAAETQSELSAFERRLYGIADLSPLDAADIVREGMAHLAPYVLEAALRGLDVAADLQSAIGRTGQLGGVTRLAVSGKVLELP
jgi:hypothetical protein